MRVGEVADFVLKPDYAYGENGSGSSIPPNATLNLYVCGF
jgi:FKBP-type peptidyl-prolyl cis-trans isomerase